MRVLLFSPFAGVWPHSLSEHQLSAQLDRRDFRVSVARCRGLFNSHCVVMESKRMPHDASRADKEAACRECRSCANLLTKSFPFEEIVLDDHVDAGVLQLADSIAASATSENYSALLHDGLEIGRLCSYETLIKFKKTSLSLNDEELRFYKKSLYQAVVSYEACRSVLDFGSYDRVLIYSPQYGVNMMCAEAAMRRDIPVYFLEGSSSIRERYVAVRVWSWPDFGLVNPALSYFTLEVARPDDEDLERVGGHLDEIASGRSYSVYSTTSKRGTDIRKFHQIPADSKVLLAALSSYDEAYSAIVIGGFPKEKFVSDVYVDQFEWIRALISWVSTLEGTHLVVRLHPRDLPNRRESIVSEQASKWDETLRNLPTNVSIDHPDEKIPLDDYFSTIDALTTGWSSTAIEAMVRSVPVVTYDQHLPSYPNEIHYTGRSQDEYFANLNRALAAPHEESIREGALAWLSFTFNRGTVRVRGRLFDQALVQRHRLLYYAIGGFSRCVGRAARALDVRLGHWCTRQPDSRVFNQTVKESKTSLFETL